MKVKITYTTNFNDVPYECWRLLDHKIHDGFKANEQLSLLYKLLDTNEDINLTLETIEQLRLILADYDQTLSEIYNILCGWKEIHLQDAPAPVIDIGTQQSK